MTNGTPSPYDPASRGGRDQAGSGQADDTSPPAGRRRLRRLVPLGLAAWALLEIWLLMLVADAATGFTVLGLLIAALVLGALTIKWAGRRAWRDLSSALQSGPDAATGTWPGGERRTSGNALAMLGGLLLMIPGLVSDLLGLLCLFPPTAALLRRAGRRITTRGDLGEAMEQAQRVGEQARIHRPDGKVVQGEVIRDDERPDR